MAIYFLRVAKLGIGVDLLGLLSMGDIYDMLIEQGNDLEEYPTKGTQEDIDQIFGG